MPEPIDLTETAPGQWSFVRRMRLQGPKRRKPTPQEIATWQEAFLNSLSGEAIKPKPDHWWTGWFGAGIAPMLLFAGGILPKVINGQWQPNTISLGDLGGFALGISIFGAPWLIGLALFLIRLVRSRLN
jgi:hypothetical protein